jgi:hypothetical protein
LQILLNLNGSGWGLAAEAKRSAFGMRSHRRYKKSSFKARYGTRHVSQRTALTTTVAGIDKDIEVIFLHLPAHQLARLLQRYEDEYGSQALAYARKTYEKWKSGQVKMSGLVVSQFNSEG